LPWGPQGSLVSERAMSEPIPREAGSGSPSEASPTASEAAPYDADERDTSDEHDTSDAPADETGARAPAAPSRASEPRPTEPPLTAEELEPRLASLPARPGCYIFRDRRGEVLYVGKAKSLRSRVRSYFQPGSSDDRAFLPFLRSAFGRF